jgi:hypothetical protein
MRVLAPGSAHARPSAQPPIDTSRNFSLHVSGRGGSTNLKHFPISFLAILGDSMHLSGFFRKKIDPPGGSGVHKIDF